MEEDWRRGFLSCFEKGFVDRDSAEIEDRADVAEKRAASSRFHKFAVDSAGHYASGSGDEDCVALGIGG